MFHNKLKVEIFLRLCNLEEQVYDLTNRVEKLEDKKTKKVKK